MTCMMLNYIERDQTSFWKSWNYKFNRNKVFPLIIDGVSGEKNIADQFAKYLNKISKSESDNSVESQLSLVLRIDK